MPIPLILGGIAVASGALGVGKGIKAAMDNSEASWTNRSAKSMYLESSCKLATAKNTCSYAINALGSQKLYVLQSSVQRFCDLFGQLKNVDLGESAGLSELERFKVDKLNLGELRQMTNVAQDVAASIAGGAGAGVITAFGAWGLASTFAAASTGTAIATLSGAAATNATLAFFGGGSLAAGGLGMAGGAAVLGGLIAGPALAVMGFVLGGQASANLNRANSNYDEALTISSEHAAARAACNGIRRRAYMFYRLLARLDALLLPLLSSLDKIISEAGTDYSRFTQDQKHTVAASVSVVMTIKAVLDTAILSEDGKLTSESASVAQDARQFIADK